MLCPASRMNFIDQRRIVIPSPVLLTRLDTGHIRSLSAAAERSNSVPPPSEASSEIRVVDGKYHIMTSPLRRSRRP